MKNIAIVLKMTTNYAVESQLAALTDQLHAFDQGLGSHASVTAH